MKLIIRCFIILGLIISYGCNTDSIDSEINSDCQRPNDELLCWTIIDDETEKGIGGAFGSLDYGTGPYQFIFIGSTDSGLVCFCFPIGGAIISGFIRAEGYEQLDMSGLIPSDISIVRLIPLE